MEELLDLQLFAGEGVSGGGSAAGGEGNGKADSAGTPGSAFLAENSEPKRNRAARAWSEDTDVSSALAGGPAAPSELAGGPAAGGVSETERDRAAKVRNENTDVSCALKKHFQRLEGEAEQMREVFPGFDLRRELRDPRFAALTAPGMGVSVEDAYYALHRRELQAASMQVAARSAARKIASSIQSAARRPVENGGASVTPAGIGPQNLSREQREALRQRIHNAAALGTKIYP